MKEIRLETFTVHLFEKKKVFNSKPAVDHNHMDTA